MARIETDLDQIIAAMKAQPSNGSEISNGSTTRISRAKLSKPPQPKPGDYNPLAGDTPFGAAAATRKATAELLMQPLITRYVYLDKPFLIWQRPNPHLDQFIESSIQPFGSWARMQLYSEGRSFTTQLLFYYLWANESPDVAILRIDAPLVVTGTAFARGSSSFFGGNHSFVGASLLLDQVKWTGWGPNPSNGASQVNDNLGAQATQRALVLEVQADGGFFSADESSTSLSNQYVNAWTTFNMVPPGASIIVRVTVDLTISTEGSTISDQCEIDFATKGGFISSPHVVLTVQTAT